MALGGWRGARRLLQLCEGERKRTEARGVGEEPGAGGTTGAKLTGRSGWLDYLGRGSGLAGGGEGGVKGF